MDHMTNRQGQNVDLGEIYKVEGVLGPGRAIKHTKTQEHLKGKQTPPNNTYLLGCA